MIPEATTGGMLPGAPGVVPVLIGPLQALLAILPGLLLALAGAVVGTVLALFRPGALKKGARLLWRLKLYLLAAAVCIAALVWLAGRLLPGRAAPAPAAGFADGDWPMFRGGPARRGAPPGEIGPARGGINWIWRQDQERFYSSPAVIGNRVYVASATVGAFSGEGAIYCFDADTGAVLWKAIPDGYRPTFSSPAVAAGRLVCGEGLHTADDARIVCLDVRPPNEGRVLWTFTTESHVECAPVIADGRVYIGAGDDGYYCLDLDGDGAGGAKVLWHTPPDNYPDAETALAVHDGTIYAGLGLGGRALCVLDAATGREIKRIPTPHPVFGPPAIADGKLYVGMGSGDFVKAAEEVGATPAGEIWCIDLARREVDWKFPVARTVLGAVAVADEEIYFGSRDGWLYCLRRDGKLVGKWNAHAPIKASPAVTDRHVYFITDTGTLYGLTRRTLEPVWEVKAAGGPMCISSPAVAGGRVFVGTENDGFLSAGQPGAKEVPLWAGRLGGPGRGGGLDGSPIPRIGEFHWQYPPDQAGQTKQATVTAPPAVLDGNAFVPLADDANGGLVCLPVAAARNDAPPPRWVYRTPNGVRRSPAVLGARVFVTDGRPGQPGRQLHCLDARTGEPAWRVPVAEGASGILALTREHLLVQDAPGGLSCFDLSGDRLWSQEVGSLSGPPAATPSMVVAAVAAPPALTALDRPTGKALWRAPLNAPPTDSPAVHRTTILLGTQRGLEARSLIDGSPLPADRWQVAGGGAAGDFVLATDRIAYVNASGELVVLSRQDGRVTARLPGALRHMAPLLSRGRLLYASRDGELVTVALDELDAGAPRPTEWADASWLGPPTCPMVLAGSHVYVGMAGWGLVRWGAGR